MIVSALSFGLFIAPVFAADEVPQPGIPSHLVLRVQPYQDVIPERAPLPLRLTLRNEGSEPVNVFFKEGRDMRARDLFTLRAVDEGGTKHVLKALTLSTATVVRAPGSTLAPGAIIETDHVMCLHSPPTAQDHPDKATGYFLAPGRYDVHVTLDCPPLVRSNEFDLVVTEPAGGDAQALALFPVLPYYAQGVCRSPEAENSWAFGGTVDEVKSKLARIQREYPDSSMARWVAYWSKFHAMDAKDLAARGRAVNEAIAYAREHASFPLVDQLMLRAAERLVNLGEPDRAEKLVNEIRKSFPSTTCSRREMARIEHEAIERKLASEEEKNDP
jgi:hypothetical protein